MPELTRRTWDAAFLSDRTALISMLLDAEQAFTGRTQMDRAEHLADALRGDLAIPADVLTVHDGTDGDCDGCSPLWSRTYTAGEWKGYKDGGKCYLSEAELLRRWGPVTRVPS